MNIKYKVHQYFIILTLFLMPQLLFSTPQLNIHNKEDIYQHFKVEYFIEKDSKNYTIETLSNKDFKPLNSAFSLGYQDTPIWFHFNICNNSNQEKIFILEISEMFHKTVDLYALSKGKMFFEHNGLSVPINERNVNVKNPSFRLVFSPHENKEIYLKLESTYGVFGEINLKSEKTFYSDTSILDNMIVFYFGAVLLIVLYNLFIFVFLREKIYLYYIGYVLTFAIWVALYRGFFLYIVDKSTYDLLQVSIPIFFIMLILFSQAILETKKYLPTIHKILNFFMILLVPTLIWMIISLHEAFHFMNIIVTPILPLLLLTAILTINKNKKIAIIYLIVLFIYFVGTSLVAVLALGLIEYTELISNAAIIGSFFEIILFALLLAYRINILRVEKIVSQNKLLAYKENEKKRLSFMVEEKTKALNILNDTLTEELKNKKKLEETLVLHATTDFLTDTLNRRSFFDICSQEVLKAKRYFNDLSFLIIDIDYFKEVNDTYGHLNGDIVLVELVQEVKNTIRETDTLGRIGGEEFAVLLPESSADDALNLATRIRESVEKKIFILEGDEVKITVSIGVGKLTEHDTIIQTILKRADIALFKAKNNGRNQICCADELR